MKTKSILENILPNVERYVSPDLLVSALNVYSSLKPSCAKFGYHKDTRLYWASYKQNSDDQILFAHKMRCFRYTNGIHFRCQKTARRYFIDQIPIEPGDIVIDCGANVGEIWFALNKRCKGINYIGFEPSLREFLALQKNVRGGEIHQIALWKEDTELTFYVSSELADSSLIQPGKFTEKVTVQASRLEHFIKGRVRLLKLEAEGAEPEILLGAGEKIAMIDYVAADLGFERGVARESTFVPVTNYLLSKGFELVELGKTSRCALFKNRRAEN